MKKLLFFLLVAGWVLPLHAQPVPQYILNPTDSIVFDPMINNDLIGGEGNGHHQILFYPSDFPNMPKGYITKVYFMMVGTFIYPRPACTVTSPHTFIGMKAYAPPPDENGTTAMSLPPCDVQQTPPAQWIATDTVFYADSFQYQVTIDSGDWFGITLQKPFLYDPAHNFIFDLSVLARTPMWFCKWFTPMGCHYYSSPPNIVRHYTGLSEANATQPTTDVLGCGGPNFPYLGFDLTPVQDVATVAAQAKALRIAPNPATSILNIEHATAGYQITDVTGKILLQGSKPTQQIDISSLAKGIYFFRSGEETLKFIKQ